MKALEPGVEGVVLKMHEQRHLILLRQLRHDFDVSRIARYIRLLLPDANGAPLQEFFHLLARIGAIVLAERARVKAMRRAAERIIESFKGQRQHAKNT